MRNFRTKTLSALAGLAVGLGLAASAQAQTIRFAHVDPADWQSSKKGAAAEIFKNIVEGETGTDCRIVPGWRVRQ